MKNAIKYQDFFIKELSDRGFSDVTEENIQNLLTDKTYLDFFAVSKNKPVMCHDIRCINCDFWESRNSCYSEMHEWLEAETTGGKKK